MNLSQRFLNIHVRKSNGGNYAIETLIPEGQALTGTLHVRSVAKACLGNRETCIVDIESCNLIRRGNSP